MDNQKLEEILLRENEPKFRLEQIKKAVYKDGVLDFSEISNISKGLREKLGKEIDILSFEVEKVLKSIDGQSVKALLRLRDDNLIETVLISPLPGHFSACISSQVGCQLGCAFCMTGKGGFKRNLTAEEITDQVLFWRQFLKSQKEKKELNSIVYMGMGEPFLNWENVSKSLEDLTEPDLFGLGSRSVSVSTAGIPEGIGELAKKFPQINLAISLHFATDEKRNRFMPVNKKYNLDELRNSLRNYFEKSNRKVFLEYIMLFGINDSQKDADDLIGFIKSIGHKNLLHVNLIKYNSGIIEREMLGSEEFKSPKGHDIQKFKNYLSGKGIGVTTRKSLGNDIQGACGQLAGK